MQIRSQSIQSSAFFCLLFLVALSTACATRSPSTSASPGEVVAPAPPPEPYSAEPVSLAIASWNVRRLGHGQSDLEAIANVLGRFDLVAMQEVMTRDVADELDARLAKHAVLLTDTPAPPTGTHREYFAFVYREQRLTPVFSSFVPDPHERFARAPFLACFELRYDTAHGDPVCLLTLHVVYGRSVAPRKAEIDALGDALTWAQNARTTPWWLVLGDFNRRVIDRRRGTPADEWSALLDSQRDGVPLRVATEDVPTTLGTGAYANAYDHVLVSDVPGLEVLERGRVDLVGEMCGGDFASCRRTISDHAPVFVRVMLQPG